LVVVDFVGHGEEGCVIAGPLLHVDDEVAMRVHQVLFQFLQMRNRFLEDSNRICKYSIFKHTGSWGPLTHETPLSTW